jgi:hypothetical protein
MYQGNVQAAVDQANLLSGVRNDIESVSALSVSPARVGVLNTVQCIQVVCRRGVTRGTGSD